MNTSNILDTIEEKYYGDLDEDKSQLIPVLKELHQKVQDNEEYDSEAFAADIAGRFGGAYLPYVFWEQLYLFTQGNNNRKTLQELITTFSTSDFEEPETKYMKILLIVYFNIEKSFEINRTKELIIAKAHPEIQEYFNKLLTFVEKNERSVKMYMDKWNMLRSKFPNFERLNMPIKQLKEEAQNA